MSDDVQATGGNPSPTGEAEERKELPTGELNDAPLSIDEAVNKLKSKRDNAQQSETLEDDSDADTDDSNVDPKARKKEEEEEDQQEEDEDAESDEETEEEGESDDDDDSDTDDADSVRIKVNGEMKDVTFDELISTYSKSQGLEAKIQANVEESKKLKSKEVELNKYHHDAFNHLVDLGKRLNEQIRTDDRFSQSEMGRLRVEDPAEWGARNQELRDKQDSLRRVSELQQRKGHEEAERRKAQDSEYAQTEVKKLSSKYPELKNQKALESKLDEVGEYLTKSYGFKQDEVDSLMRADMWDIAIKAMAFDQSKANVSDLANRIKKAPKMVKPGAREQQLNANSGLKREIQNLEASLLKTGSQKDAVKLLSLKNKLRAQTKR